MFSRLLQRFGTRFYNKEQEYKASYEVTVSNSSRASQEGTVFIPVVSSTQYQTLLNDINLEPEMTPLKEHEHKNAYAYRTIRLDPQESITIKQIFEIKVSPFKKDAREFRLKDYEKLEDEIKNPYLKANEYLAGSDPKMIELANSIAGSSQDLQKILKRINEYVIKHLSYGNKILGLYPAQNILTNQLTNQPTNQPVDCGGFDTFFISLCQAVGIPARIVSGFWAGYPINDMHAWVEIMLPDGSWMPADPSIEHLTRKNRTRKSGALGFVGSDRVTFSTGCELKLHTKDEEFYTDILQNPIIYPENPKLKILRVFTTQPL